jgi:hypothetical protein
MKLRAGGDCADFPVTRLLRVLEALRVTTDEGQHLDDPMNQ